MLRLETDSAGKPTVSIVSRTGPSSVGTPDQLSWAQADGMARQVAPYRMSQVTGGDEPLSVATELPELLGIGEVGALTPAITWRPRPSRERLRVPIGVTRGRRVELDLKESAQGGMGPHGLLIGATGSGKSELLRTLVLGLAATHSSEVLNLVLVDFKGGATFLGMDDPAAHLRGDHQPGRRAPPGRPHAGLAQRRDDPPPGSACASAATPSLFDYEKARAAGAAARAAADAAAGRATSSPSCWPASRSSSTCSSPSAGSAAASACTCCSPRSGWTRAASAGSRATCPTGSRCAPSPRWSRAA